MWSFSALCDISNLQFLKVCSSPKFHPIHPNFIQGILIMGQYRLLLFFGDCQILKSQRYISHNFHCSPSKLYDNIGYHGKPKCLLEYCNEKLASSTYDNIFYLNKSKHSSVLGLHFKQRVKAPGPLVSLHGQFMN